MIQYICKETPLEQVNSHIRVTGSITGMSLSPDGTLLATFCNTGSVQIWDVETYELLINLRDEYEENIDEFYVGTFSPNMKYIVTAGKSKDRKRWSKDEDDNFILPTSIKVCIKLF
jgi:WD40 repeat protein